TDISGFQQGQAFPLAQDKFRHLRKHPTALGRGRSGPGSRIECSARRLHGCVDVSLSAPCYGREDLTVRRADYVDRASVQRRSRLATDEVSVVLDGVRLDLRRGLR